MFAGNASTFFIVEKDTKAADNQMQTRKPEKSVAGQESHPVQKTVEDHRQPAQDQTQKSGAASTSSSGETNTYTSTQSHETAPTNISGESSASNIKQNNQSDPVDNSIKERSYQKHPILWRLASSLILLYASYSVAFSHPLTSLWSGVSMLFDFAIGLIIVLVNLLTGFSYKVFFKFINLFS